MAAFELSEWIDAAPDVIFALMTDPSQAPKVMKGVQSLEKLTDGPIRPGTRLRETRLMGGKPAQAELVVEVIEPPEKYVVSTEQSGVTITYTYTLRPEKNGTRVTLEAELTSSGLKRGMLPLIAAILKREDKGHLTHLKTAVETAA